MEPDKSMRNGLMKLLLTLAFGCLLLPFCFAQTTNTAPSAPDLSKVAALVNGVPITLDQLNAYSASQDKALAAKYTGMELQEKQYEAHEQVLQSLIDRTLIIQAFQKSGGTIPDKYINEQVQAVIKADFQGKPALLNKMLADRGVTMADFKREIANNAILDQMQRKFVLDKVQAKGGPDMDAEIKALQAAWLTLLRSNADIRNLTTAK